MLAAAILVFSAAELRGPIEPFQLDRTPPPPPENIAAHMPAFGESASTSMPGFIALLH